MDEQFFSEYAKKIGAKGGNATVKNKGKEHFIAIRKFSALKDAGCTCTYQDVSRGFLAGEGWSHDDTCPLKNIDLSSL